MTTGADGPARCVVTITAFVVTSVRSHERRIYFRDVDLGCACCMTAEEN